MTKRISHPAQNAKRFCKRLTAAALILLLIAMFIPSAIASGNKSAILPDADIPETLTRAQLEAHGAVARLRAEEPDEFTFVYLNEDGTRTSYSYGVAVKYEENGEYVDKNNTIKDFNNEYGNTASDVELRFPKHLNKISIKYKNHNIKIKPVTDVSAGHINASVSGNTVTYPNAFGQGMDLRYSSTMSGMKEDIILQSYQGVNTFSFEVETAGLELKKLGGQYVIADDEEVIFSFGDLEVTDSFTGENEATDNWDEHITYAQGNIQTVKENDKYIFTITVDEDFLCADTTVYPVYIDPSFNVTSNYIQDTHISEGHPDTNYGTSTSMRLGYNLAHQRNRILVKISNLTNGQTQSGLTYSTVNSANYYMYCTTTYTSHVQVDAYMVPLTAAVWTESGATWNNASDSTSYNATLNGVATVGSAGWYSFNVKKAYTSWLAVTTNKGLMFRMNNESTEQSNIRNFASVNNADSTKLPYLTVNYETNQYILASPPTCILKEGGTCTAQVMTNIASEDIVWTSDDIAVASVSTQGVINAHSPGVATITASSRYNSSICSSITVTVIRIELNHNVVYVAKGKTLATQATITPDSATITGITYSSDDTTVATVDDSGVITAVSAGTAMISARTTPGDAVASIAVIVPDFEDGEYYIQNKATKYYMDVQNGSTAMGANVQQEYFDAANSQVWVITLQPNGYYTLKPKNSGQIAGVGSTEGSTVMLMPYMGAQMHWKLEKLTNGAYKIVPQNGEASGFALAVASNSQTAGVDILQKTYTSDTNYTDEWIIDEVLDDYTLMYIGNMAGDPKMDDIINNKLDFYLTQTSYEGNVYQQIDKNTALREISSATVFSCLTHGNSTSISLDGDDPLPSMTITVSDIQNLDEAAFVNTQLVVLGACSTGYKLNETDINFVDAIYEAGAKIVIGFKYATQQDEMNIWMTKFMTNIYGRRTVQEALDAADAEVLSKFTPAIGSTYTTTAVNRYIQCFYKSFNGENNLNRIIFQ